MNRRPLGRLRFTSSPVARQSRIATWPCRLCCKRYSVACRLWLLESRRGYLNCTHMNISFSSLVYFYMPLYNLFSTVWPFQTKGLRSKRRNSPYIFRVVASLPTKACSFSKMSGRILIDRALLIFQNTHFLHISRFKLLRSIGIAYTFSRVIWVHIYTSILFHLFLSHMA